MILLRSPSASGDSLPHDGGSCPVGDCINIFLWARKPPGYQPEASGSRSIWLKGGLQKMERDYSGDCCALFGDPSRLPCDRRPAADLAGGGIRTVAGESALDAPGGRKVFPHQKPLGAHRISGPQKAFPRFYVDGQPQRFPRSEGQGEPRRSR